MSQESLGQLWVAGQSKIGPLMSIRTPGRVFRNSGDGGELSVGCAGSQDVLEFSITNNSGHDIFINDVQIDLPAGCLAELGLAKDCRQYIHGIDFVPNDGVKSMHMPTGWAEVDSSSSMLTVVSNDRTGRAVLLGALPPYSKGFTWFDVLHETRHKAGGFGMRVRVDYRLKLPAGQTLQLPPLVVLEGDCGEELMEQYASLSAERSELANRKANITGWSSWDYYAGSVARGDMDENREACVNNFGDDAEYMIIDDGYQNIWGHWDANWKFPEGLADYCSACVADGKKPGVWIAPLMVSVHSPLFRERPGWFTVCDDGNVYEFMAGSWGKMGQLDPTIPEVQEHLRNIFGKLRADGFVYFKIDFTQQLLSTGNYSDATVGRAGVYRVLFELIRQAIGPDAYLMGCGAPYEAVIGTVDAVRSGGDIHNYAPMAVQCSRSLFGRLWMQRSVCNIDPDFMIVRGPDTSDEKYCNRRLPVAPRESGLHWFDGPEFDVDGARFWALACYLAGGDMTLGDRIAGLNDVGMALVRKVLKPGRPAARWVNQFAPRGQDCPVIVAEYPDRYEIGIFNMSETKYVGAIPAAVPGNAGSAQDFWTGQAVDTSSIELWPETAMGLVIKK